MNKTNIFSIFHLLVFHLPLLCSLLYKMELRSSEKEESRIALAISNIPVTIVLSMQVIWIHTMHYVYFVQLVALY